MRYVTLGEVVALHRLSSKARAGRLAFVISAHLLDGNKRVAHRAMEAFLMLNGAEIVAAVYEQERLVLDLAAGVVTREELTEWLEKHLQSARS